MPGPLHISLYRRGEVRAMVMEPEGEGQKPFIRIQLGIRYGRIPMVVVDLHTEEVSEKLYCDLSQADGTMIHKVWQFKPSTEWPRKGGP